MPRKIRRDERDWLVYLLVDPSAGRLNHPRGEAFYVGMCPWQLHGEQLADPDLAGLADPAAADLADEPAVRQRLEWLVEDHVEVSVELICWQDKRIVSMLEASRVVDALRVLLQPGILNAGPKRERAFRVDGAQLRHSDRPRPRVRLPRECRALVHSVRIPPGLAGAAEASRLLALSPAALAEQVQVLPSATGSTRSAEQRHSVAKRYADGDPVLFVVVTTLVKDGTFHGHHLVESGLVLGVWKMRAITEVLVEAADADGYAVSKKVIKVIVADDDAEVRALRRHLTGGVLVDEDGISYPVAHGGQSWFPEPVDRLHRLSSGS